MHIQIVLFDGFDPLDVIAPLEVLRAAGASVELVSADGPRTAPADGSWSVPSGMAGVSLSAVAPVAPTDWLLVPGAAGSSEEEITGRLAATLRTPLPGLVAAALADPTVKVATVCGGALILAMAGLITGRAAVTHHDGMPALAAAGVRAIDARVVDDGDLVTGGGVTSGLDVGLYLAEREIGAHAARTVERLLAYERRGVVWRDPVPA
ncbi:DJ-1/PfpI family protein [Actinoplanes sp. NPDC049681]|uniref:DJ-1/PfpI family protein n=1 Tax=Actinoplanes sp. NPDC049681 TaxID=3363905 RepID=UPI00379D6082